MGAYCSSSSLTGKQTLKYMLVSPGIRDSQPIRLMKTSTSLGLTFIACKNGEGLKTANAKSEMAEALNCSILFSGSDSLEPQST